jgi:hypothetical protein
VTAVHAAWQVLTDAGHDLDILTVAAALAAAADQPSEPAPVEVTGRVGPGYSTCVAMARDTAPILATAAETYLRTADAATYVEQHITGSDGANYVVTFRPLDGGSPDELRAAAEFALAELRAAVGRLADRLDVRARDSRILSVRASLREVAKNLRDMVATRPR